ncbi:hypothetical protein GZ77_06130 [Endozoicomonas montiporae]|uniref:Flagellar FliJ protein n=2 Tax=Endozoicomonas montiporae TaxID=1027273 RepID=A0A081NC67_9GAMM|nr:flagellar FliJ family protein [Endozoicomonas montiporae]AMO56370.1 flagellar biosynthetic protein FliJ [Endozoicomonas montiporae CL-33]KEQ16040.1 hypothetical protein GZ77_06130 [Endozoicomonas montiporae]
MRKRRQLDKLKALREMQCQQVKQELAEHQGKLVQEETRLQQLEDYQKNYVWDEARQADGLLLNSAQMMAQSVHNAVLHQRQQVDVQQAQCRATQHKYTHERLRLRTAEALFDSHQKKLDKKAARQEQKMFDEASSVMLRGQLF